MSRRLTGQLRSRSIEFAVRFASMDPDMDCLIALLNTRGRTTSVHGAITLERLVTLAANRVLRRAVPSAISTIRILAIASVRPVGSGEITD